MGAVAPLRMPKLGLTMTEGVLAAWAVAVGDRVKAGDVLFTVETDKIATDVEAPGDGEIVVLTAVEGETYAVGALLAEWTGVSIEADGEPQATEIEAQPVTEVQTAEPEPRSEGIRIIATPLARRLARQSSVDLAQITGSGARGRIKARDVQAAATTTPAEAPFQPSSIVGSIAPTAAGHGETRTDVSLIRKVIARRMVEAKQTIPHFYVLAHADIGKLGKLRNELNASNKGRARISVTHLLAAAIAHAMMDMPEANEVWDDNAIVRYADIDIGIAVDSPRGLVAPLVRNAGILSLRALVDRTNALIERAREGRLASEELIGGAIAISNVGMFGASALVPIVNPGQSCILGVGGSEKLFRPDAEGNPRLCEELNLVLSCDHRVWDGARAARFLDRIRELIENPLNLLT